MVPAWFAHKDKIQQSELNNNHQPITRSNVQIKRY